MVRHIRFHGRGGEGVKLASRIVSRALFLGGLNVQDSPLYGAERRGAPVVAFTRFSEGPIHERGYIEKPEVAVLMDHSLLNHPEAAVLAGLDETSLLLVNSTHTEHDLKERYQTPARVATLDITSIALDLLGHQLLSAPIAGFTAKAAGLARQDQVAEAVQTELAAVGLSQDLIERNLRATQRAYDATASVGLSEPRQAPPTAAHRPFVIPRLPARTATPIISAEATSLLRTTEGWRVYRPIIERGLCTRCFICFALCPEGAIQLDPQNYPIIDYAHCKGCLVCMTECPPRAISDLREDAA
ncbi:MAG: 2-oxoacid:acceptor oxidoreductase family protein [Candidatus Binatia bacterium]